MRYQKKKNKQIIIGNNNNFNKTSIWKNYYNAYNIIVFARARIWLCIYYE